MTRTPIALFAFALAAAQRAVAGPTAEDAEHRIRMLENRVAQLEREAQEREHPDRTAIVDAILEDARRRGQLLADVNTVSAGYDNGFYIRAGDDFVLTPSAQIQFRGVLNHHDSDDAPADDETDSGFEIRRLRLTLGGTAFRRFTYKFQWSTRTTGGEVRLTDGWVEYAIADEWVARLGQFKEPVHHEELVGSRNQLAAERTLANEVLGGGINGRTQGIGLTYGNYSPGNPLNVDVVFHDGAGQSNTAFNQAQFDLGVSGRLEWKLAGDWASYRDFSAMRNKQDLAVIGVATSWSQAGDADLVTATADIQWENTSGLGIYAAVLLADRSGDLDFAFPSGTSWGALVQAGYLLNPSWEVFVRANAVVFREAQPLSAEPGDADDVFSEFTIGINHFLGEGGAALHRAKLTFDVTYLPDGTPAELVDPADFGAGGADGEWILRAQFQLVL